MHQDVEREFASRSSGRRGVAQRRRFEVWYWGWRRAARGLPPKPPTGTGHRKDYMAGYDARRRSGAP